MKRLIPKDLLTGQRGHVLDSYQATDDLRQVLSYPDELLGFDDLLSAIGANRSNYMQSAHQQKLFSAVSSGDWVIVKQRVNSDNGGASWNGFKPNPNRHRRNTWSKSTHSPFPNRQSRVFTSSRNP
jgi:hypothetical protein